MEVEFGEPGLKQSQNKAGRLLNLWAFSFSGQKPVYRGLAVVSDPDQQVGIRNPSVLITADIVLLPYTDGPRKSGLRGLPPDGPDSLSYLLS